ncbi:hypothetical protein HNY73_005948 [Argiope bruennichi]|uniref:Uncharacterized protein n=1 Tax=Argiope bruennichi TaxID=94029 RepID=A0A8T0FJ31_ARGBR|nr:hypothetical protein HNY73_005948 [Argiope bruennichi]
MEDSKEMAGESQIDFFIRKLDEFVDEQNQTSAVERKIKGCTEIFIFKMQLFKKAEACEALLDNEYLFKLLTDYCHKIKAFLDDKQSFLNDLFSQDFNRFSRENQQRMYFTVITLQEKMKTENMMINFINRDCENYSDDLLTFTEVSSKFRRNKKLKSYIREINRFCESLLDCDALSSEILAHLEENISSLFQAEDDKVNLFIIIFKKISDSFRESALKERSATKLMESILRDIQPINDKENENTEVSKVIDLIKRDVKRQEEEGWYHDLIDLSENPRSIVDYLKVDEIDGLSVDNQKKIFLTLRNVREQRKSQIERIKSIKSECEKILKEFDKLELLKKWRFTANKLFRQIVFNKTISYRIEEASQDYLSTSIVLNNLREKCFPSLNPEEQVDVITEKLKEIKETSFKTNIIEEIKKIRESLNIKLQSLKKSGTEEEEIIKFFGDSEDKLKHYEEHGLEFKKRCESIDSVLNYLGKGNIDKFSFESKRKIYALLLIVRKGMVQDIVRLKSVDSKWKQYLKNGDELTSSNFSLCLIWEELLEKEQRSIDAMDSFAQSLQVKVQKANLFLNRLKTNAKRSEINFNPQLVQEETDKLEVVSFSAEVGKDAEMCDVISELKNCKINSSDEEETIILAFQSFLEAHGGRHWATEVQAGSGSQWVGRVHAPIVSWKRENSCRYSSWWKWRNNRYIKMKDRTQQQNGMARTEP